MSFQLEFAFEYTPQPVQYTVSYNYKCQWTQHEQCAINCMVQRAVLESPKFQAMLENYNQVRIIKPLHKTYDGESREHYTVSFFNVTTRMPSPSYHLFPNKTYTRFTHVTEVVPL